MHDILDRPLNKSPYHFMLPISAQMVETQWDILPHLIDLINANIIHFTRAFNSLKVHQFCQPYYTCKRPKGAVIYLMMYIDRHFQRDTRIETRAA